MRKAIGVLATQLLLCGGLVFGQIIVSSIVGTVTDPSGALIPGARVTVTNTNTGISVKATTTSNGTYSVPGLMAGTYEVAIEAPGFNNYHATGITLVSATTVRVDATLRVGNTNQSVVVRDTAQLVHTDSMSISGSVSTRQLADLPSALQTIDAVLKTAPGVMPYGANPSAAGANVNPIVGGGSHWGTVNFTLNGMEVNDPFNSGAVTIQGTGGGALVMPPPGSLQELNVKSADMTAQYEGHSTVTLVTKAGTNNFHGEAYEFLQNTALNANTYLSNSKGIPRPVDHLNQFGGNVGGPIIRRKAFFFADFNGYRHAYETVPQLHLPSMAMRTGDFSALCTTFNASGVCTSGTQLYDPYTGKPFSGNQIPSTMIAPQAKTLISYLPAPTVANDPATPGEHTFNFVGTNSAIANIYGAQLRIDYTLSSKDRIYGVYAQRVADPWGVANTSYPSNYGQTIDSYSERNISGSETHVFNPNTLNEFRAAWGDYATKFSGQNLKFDTSSLFPQDPPSVFHGLPAITASGYTGMPYDYGTGLPTPRKNVEFNDDFTYIHGRHTIQAGADENGYKIWYRVPSANGVTGLFASNGNWTGNAGWRVSSTAPHSGGNSFADFLIGVGSSSQTSATGAFATWNYSRYLGFYVQDTWQATPRLTLFYGLRVEHQTPWHQAVVQKTSFDPVNNKLVLPENSATPTLPPEATADLFAAYPYETTQSIGWSTHFNQPYGKHIAPRFGFAFRPFGNQRTVFRGGAGVYYNFVNAAVSGANEVFNPPWNIGISQQFVSKLPGSPKTPYLPDITFSDPYPSATKKAVTANPVIHYVPHDFKAGDSLEWNLTIEQQIGTNWAARISYLGNTSSHLPYNGADYNAILNQQPSIPIQKQRPYQPWSTISSFLSQGREEFNQLQLGLRKQFSQGLLFQAEYQYTRSLDDVGTSGGPEIPFVYRSNWGNSDAERRHWVVFNYDYELPFGRGRQWLRSANAFTNAIVGGWQVSGITDYGTGVPINLGISLAGTQIPGWNPFRPDRVSGAPLYKGKQSGHDIINGVQWFNTDAFIPPSCSNSLMTTDRTNTYVPKSTVTCQDVYSAGNNAGVPTYAAYGNAARNMLWGPGYWNWDMSGMKSFPIHESTKLQLRGDFIDVFNHMNLDNPNLSLPDLRDQGNGNSNFGVITSGTGNRTIQVALKLIF